MNHVQAGNSFGVIHGEEFGKFIVFDTYKLPKNGTACPKGVAGSFPGPVGTIFSEGMTTIANAAYIAAPIPRVADTQLLIRTLVGSSTYTNVTTIPSFQSEVPAMYPYDEGIIFLLGDSVMYIDLTSGNTSTLYNVTFPPLASSVVKGNPTLCAGKMFIGAAGFLKPSATALVSVDMNTWKQRMTTGGPFLTGPSVCVGDKYIISLGTTPNNSLGNTFYRVDVETLKVTPFKVDIPLNQVTDRLNSGVIVLDDSYWVVTSQGGRHNELVFISLENEGDYSYCTVEDQDNDDPFMGVFGFDNFDKSEKKMKKMSKMI